MLTLAYKERYKRPGKCSIKSILQPQSLAKAVPSTRRNPVSDAESPCPCRGELAIELPRRVLDPSFMGAGRAGKGIGRCLTMLFCRVRSFDYAGLMAAEVASLSLDWQLHSGERGWSSFLWISKWFYLYLHFSYCTVFLSTSIDTVVTLRV